MVRSFSLFVWIAVLAAPVVAVGQEQAPTFELEQLEIVGEQQHWPIMFEPDTKVEAGLAPAETATRYAYRAAEYDFAADHYRSQLTDPSWPDRTIVGDGHFERLYAGWVEELEVAAERSRTLSVQYWLAAFDVIQTAALAP